MSALHLFQYDNISTPGASPEAKDFQRLPDEKAGDPASVIPHDSSGKTDAPPPEALLARQPQGYFEINIRYSPGIEDFEKRAGEIAEMNLICEILCNSSTFSAGGNSNHDLLEHSHEKYRWSSKPTWI